MFLILSKIVGYLIYPLHLILLLIFLYLVSKKFQIFSSVSKVILGFTIAIIFLGGSNFVTSYLLWNLEQKIPQNIPKEINGVILLGGSFSHLKKPLDLNQVSLNESSERVIESLYLLREHPEAKIIFCDNKNFDDSKAITEGEQTAFFLRKFKINQDRFLILRSAQNTFQETIEIANMISFQGGNWVLVTSASHMSRAVTLFQSRELGKAKLFTLPTDFTVDAPEFLLNRYTFHLINLEKLRTVFHEYLGHFAYRLTGRTSKLWPNLNDIPING